VGLLCSPPGGSESKYALYVGNTDRSVVVYQWNNDSKELDVVERYSLPGQVCNRGGVEDNCNGAGR